MTFPREWSVKAVRDLGLCDACRKRIEAGQPARRWAGISDGEFSTAVWHPECRAAEDAMNRLHDTYNPDDWQPLSEIYAEDYEWLRAKHPTVAERMGVTA